MKIYKNVLSSQLSRWKTGGELAYLIEVNSVDEILAAKEFLKKRSLPSRVIGNTSNLLFSDNKIQAGFIRLAEGFRFIEFGENSISAGASSYVPYVVRNCVNRGLSGLEHLVGVPASIGGVVCMNAGSQRKAISENLKTVTSIDSYGNIITRRATECAFSYRQSMFQDSDEIILSAEIELGKSTPNKLRSKCLEILKSRNQKFPRKLPNCGSVFVSQPSAYKLYGPPGKMIEDCGLKGFTCGGAKISEKHANFIINEDHATSENILHLIAIAKNTVEKKFGIKMVSEVIYIKSDGSIMPCHIRACNRHI